jgi:hypothetical protein
MLKIEYSHDFHNKFSQIFLLKDKTIKPDE